MGAIRKTGLRDLHLLQNVQIDEMIDRDSMDSTKFYELNKQEKNHD